MNNKKITLICSRSISVYTFRKNLIKALQNKGYDVSVIALDNDHETQIREWGVDFYYTYQNNRSTNPIDKIKLLKEYKKILKQINPEKVFTFQVTPNTIGVLAARECRIKDIYSMVEGAGDVFIYNTLKWKIIRLFACILYTMAFKHSKKVFFLNNDDKNEFIQRKLVKSEQCVVIPGIGVDTDYFAYKSIKNTSTFLTSARMMPAKGVFEYCEVARTVKKTHPEIIFNYIGEEFTLTKKDIQEYIDDGSINYLGYVDDMRPYYEDCFCYISTSHYREGMPMVLMEAASTGRPLIVIDNIGSRDIVNNGYNGFIVKTHKLGDMVEKIIYALEHVGEMTTMGNNARELIKRNNDISIVNAKILEQING